MFVILVHHFSIMTLLLLNVKVAPQDQIAVPMKMDLYQYADADQATHQTSTMEYVTNALLANIGIPLDSMDHNV